MTNVLIIYENVEPCNIETVRVFKLLENQGLLKSRDVFASHIKKEDLIWSDTVVFVRSTSSIERDLAVIAKRMRKFVILTIDDDFLSLGDTYGADGAGYRSERHNCLKSILQTIDCLLTVNELLAKKYIELCKVDRYEITNTIVEKEEFYPTAQDGSEKENVKIAIYVNDGTQGMFNQILRPAFRLLSDRYSGRLSLYLMALKPDMTEFESSFDVHFVPHLPYQEFKNFMGTEGFDIGLAPLVDSGFSKYKYFNKYIEYTLAGIPAIYSDCALYRLVVKDGYNGYFTNNSADSWCETISRLIEDAELRKNIIVNAQKHLYENFESRKVLARFVKEIPELTNYKSPVSSIHLLSLRLLLIQTQYAIFRVRGWFGTTGTLLRKGNYRALLKRIKKRIEIVRG